MTDQPDTCTRPGCRFPATHTVRWLVPRIGGGAQTPDALDIATGQRLCLPHANRLTLREHLTRADRVTMAAALFEANKAVPDFRRARRQVDRLEPSHAPA